MIDNGWTRDWERYRTALKQIRQIGRDESDSVDAATKMARIADEALNAKPWQCCTISKRSEQAEIEECRRRG